MVNEQMKWEALEAFRDCRIDQDELKERLEASGISPEESDLIVQAELDGDVDPEFES